VATLVLGGCGGSRDGSDDPAADARAADERVARAHPRFRLSSPELLALVADAPEPVRAAVAQDAEGFLALVGLVLDLPADRTLLVDKEHGLGEYVPSNLVELDALDDRLALSRPGHRLTAPTTEALLTMSADAAADGIALIVSSAYRSYAYQADLYARWVAELGEEEADRVSARPGTSQHQLGTTADFGCICDAFASQPAGRWLAENAHRYGFSLSYPDGYEELTGYSYEPWHFRYLGVEATELERRYFGGIQQWMLEFLHRHRDTLARARDEAGGDDAHDDNARDDGVHDEADPEA